jgi:soluble lytic murein transglycosylase-like protein
MSNEQTADHHYAHIAKAHGFYNSLRTAMEARRAGISTSLGFALIEQESTNGSNVFGHDPTIFVGAGRVTREKYLNYKRSRKASQNRLMQGVGPCQLTYYSFQDEADRMGGCWIPKYNIRLGFTHLAGLIKEHGELKGLAIYNGGAANPSYDYARSVLERKAKWHKRLT